MKYFLFAASLLLASCTRPPTSPPAHSEPIGADTVPRNDTRASLDPVRLQLHAADSGYTPQQVVRRRLFGLLPAKATSPSSPLPEKVGVPRKCKGCSFNVVAGNQTVAGKKAQVAAGDGATASVVGKKAGPAIVASDSSTQNAILGGGNIQATNGNNNAPQLTAPVQQAADWRAVLAKPAGQVGTGIVAILMLGSAGYALYLIFPILKRPKPTDNQSHT